MSIEMLARRRAVAEPGVEQRDPEKHHSASSEYAQLEILSQAAEVRAQPASIEHACTTLPGLLVSLGGICFEHVLCACALDAEIPTPMTPMTELRVPVCAIRSGGRERRRT